MSSIYLLFLLKAHASIPFVSVSSGLFWFFVFHCLSDFYLYLFFYFCFGNIFSLRIERSSRGSRRKALHAAHPGSQLPSSLVSPSVLCRDPLLWIPFAGNSRTIIHAYAVATIQHPLGPLVFSFTYIFIYVYTHTYIFSDFRF